MKRILITGMSGTGKSPVLDVLRSRGFVAIDTDYDYWCAPMVVPDTGEEDWVWREDSMRDLLTAPLTTPLFVSGCRSNQSKFYEYFEHKVLLSAPLNLILERVAHRSTNPYGKTEAQRAEITSNFELVQPLPRSGCDIELDSSSMTIQQMADFLAELASDNSVESDASSDSNDDTA